MEFILVSSFIIIEEMFLFLCLLMMLNFLVGVKIPEVHVPLSVDEHDNLDDETKLLVSFDSNVYKASFRSFFDSICCYSLSCASYIICICLIGFLVLLYFFHMLHILLARIYFDNHTS